MSKPGQVERVRDGLARQRAAEDRPGCGAPTARRRRPRRRATTPIRRSALGRRPSPANQAIAAQMRPARPSRCGSAPRGRAGRPSAISRGSVSRAPRGSRDDPGHEQARAEHEHRERHRRVGQGRVEQQRQVDRGRQAGADGQSPARAFGARPRSAATSARQAPGQHRHERARRGRCETWAAGERRAEERHRDGGQEGRQRQPDLERRAREDERRGLVAPQRVGDEPAALERGCGRRRRSRPCPPASGRRSARRRRRATTSATTKTRSRRQDRLAPGHEAGHHGQDRPARPVRRRQDDRRRPSQAGRSRRRGSAPRPRRCPRRRGRASGCRRRARPRRSVSIGSLTRTTPPRPVQYFVAGRIDRHDAVGHGGAGVVERVGDGQRTWRRLSAQTCVDERASRRPRHTAAKARAAPVKTRRGGRRHPRPAGGRRPRRRRARCPRAPGCRPAARGRPPSG